MFRNYDINWSILCRYELVKLPIVIYFKFIAFELWFSTSFIIKSKWNAESIQETKYNIKRENKNFVQTVVFYYYFVVNLLHDLQSVTSLSLRGYNNPDLLHRGVLYLNWCVLSAWRYSNESHYWNAIINIWDNEFSLDCLTNPGVKMVSKFKRTKIPWHET